LSTIPSGFVICDGSNGTPDLRNRFIVGAGDNYVPDDTGGENSVTLTEAEMPSHTHEFFDGKFGNNNESIAVDAGGFGTLGTSHFTRPSGGDQAHENRPPYYALAFIMKT